MARKDGMMIYNIGDKVIDKENISFLFNPFWKDDYRKTLVETVFDANEEYFTAMKSIEYGCRCGANEYVLHYQTNGRQRFGNKTYLHLMKDHEEIVALINQIGSERYKKNDDFITDKINTAIIEKETLLRTYNDDLQIALELVEI
jgi:hypothetical protein